MLQQPTKLAMVKTGRSLMWPTDRCPMKKMKRRIRSRPSLPYHKLHIITTITTTPRHQSWPQTPHTLHPLRHHFSSSTTSTQQETWAVATPSPCGCLSSLRDCLESKEVQISVEASRSLVATATAQQKTPQRPSEASHPWVQNAPRRTFLLH